MNSISSTAGEFWSHWLQYLAIFTIFRNFFFILYLAPAIICNVVDWSADSKLYLGKFSYHAGTILSTSRRRKKNVGVKSQRWHPSIWTNFCQKMPFLILRRFIYSFGPPFLYKQEKYWKYWLQYLAGPAIPNCQRWYWKYWLQNLFQEMCKIIFWTTFP